MDYEPYSFNKEPIVGYDDMKSFMDFYLGSYVIDSKVSHDPIIKGGVRADHEWLLKLFKTLLELHLEWVLDVHIKSSWDDIWEKNADFEAWLSDYSMDASPIDRLIWIKGKWFNILGLWMDFWRLEKAKVKYTDWFFLDAEIHGYRFLELFFRRVTERFGYDDIYKGEVVRELGQAILRKTGGDPNYEGEVILRYPYDRYIQSKRCVLPFLTDMERQKIWKLERVTMNCEEFSFTLKDFNGCHPEIFQKNFDDNLMEISFSDGKCTMNGVEVEMKENDKSSEFLKLSSLAFEDFWTPSIPELIETFSKNSERFKKLSENDLKVDNIRKTYVQTINKRIEEKVGVKEFLDMKKSLLKSKKPVRK